MNSFLSWCISAVLTFFSRILTGSDVCAGVGSHVHTDAGLKKLMLTGSVHTHNVHRGRHDACTLHGARPGGALRSR